MSSFITFINSSNIRISMYCTELIMKSIDVSIGPMAQKMPGTLQVDTNEGKLTLIQVQKRDTEHRLLPIRLSSSSTETHWHIVRTMLRNSFFSMKLKKKIAAYKIFPTGQCTSIYCKKFNEVSMDDFQWKILVQRH
jgi:hypothetical protein